MKILFKLILVIFSVFSLLNAETNTSCDCGDFKSQDEINKFFGVKSGGNSNSNSDKN